MESSVGARLDFYRNSLAILREHPLAGTGTGGFAKAYADRVRGTEAYVTRNPHNEYLLIATQVGIAGFLALLYLFWMQWRLAPRLPSPLECQLARGLVLMMAAGCLFNSLLLDHTEGLLYAWLTGLLFAGLQSRHGS
jgi:O-antigen ligase